MSKLMYTNYLFLFMLILITLLLLSNLKNHPMMIINLMLIYISLVCMHMSQWKHNFMFSIFIFLMMISGLLIMFLYFSSLISNEQSKFKTNLFNLVILLCLFMFLIYKFKSMNLFMYKYNFHEINKLNNFNDYNFINIMNLYDYPLNNLTILSMFYLLLSLFSIIKICSFKSFSLRKMK